MRLIQVLLVLWLTGLLGLAQSMPVSAQGSIGADGLSPYWGGAIRQWSDEILLISERYGIDPDLIAAVIFAESGGQATLMSYMGAVGLMGVMPAGPGFEFRPTADQLMDPYTNLNWGAAILADIIRQTGGDIGAALAAYNGGWDYASRSIPRGYAAQVLDAYGRAVASRNNIPLHIAPGWTVAFEIRRGNIAAEPLILNQPVYQVQTYGEHVAFNHVDANGRSYYVKAYAVPVAVPPAPSLAPAPADVN